MTPPAAVPPRALLGAAAALLRRGAAHFNASRPAAAAAAFRSALGLLSPWQPLGLDQPPPKSGQSDCDSGNTYQIQPDCLKEGGGHGRVEKIGDNSGGANATSAAASAGAAGGAAFAALRAPGRRAAARALANLAAALLRLGRPAEALEACNEVTWIVFVRVLSRFGRAGHLHKGV